MKVADTSFLVAFFDADDRRNVQARDAFASTNPLIICPEVLVETLRVIKAKAGRGAADAALEDLMRVANVEWAQESDIPATWRIYEAEAPLSFVDASVVQLCIRRAVEPLTFDDRQAKAVTKRLTKR